MLMANSRGVRRDLDVARRHHEAADLAVQREGMRAVADRQHQHRARAVRGVAGADLGGARLQEVFVARRGDVVRAAQHREDGADRDVHVDVRAAVQRIEQQQIVAALEGVGNRLAVVHLFRRQAGEVAAPGVGFEQDVVRQHVELLLRLALDVAGTGITEHTAQCTLADRDRDGLAGAGHDFDQQAQVGVDAAGVLFLDQVTGEGNGLHGIPE